MIYLVPALADRTKTLFVEEIMKNVTFSILLYCDLGCCYNKKWLQYQMLGLMSGLELCTFISPVISNFSDFLSFEKGLKRSTLELDFSKRTHLHPIVIWDKS